MTPAAGAPAAARAALRSATRYITVVVAATMKIPDEMIAAVTWIAIQYECSAGISGPAAVYSTVAHKPSPSTTGTITNRPRKYARYRTARARNTMTAPQVIAVTNS